RSNSSEPLKQSTEAFDPSSAASPHAPRRGKRAATSVRSNQRGEADEGESSWDAGEPTRSADPEASRRPRPAAIVGRSRRSHSSELAALLLAPEHAAGVLEEQALVGREPGEAAARHPGQDLVQPAAQLDA